MYQNEKKKKGEEDSSALKIVWMFQYKNMKAT